MDNGSNQEIFLTKWPAPKNLENLVRKCGGLADTWVYRVYKPHKYEGHILPILKLSSQSSRKKYSPQIWYLVFVFVVDFCEVIVF